MTNMVDRISVIIEASTGAAVRPLSELQKEAAKTDTAFARLSKNMGISASSLKAGLVAGATALVGTGLISFLDKSAEKFGEGAKQAGELAKATGGTVEEVSRMQAALQDAGISTEQSATMLTRFTTNATKNQKAIESLGVTFKRNKDGTVDYAQAMVDTVDAIDKVGDGAKRNQLLVANFGKQGAAAFNELHNSGISLSQAMAAIEKHRVFTTADVVRAAQYDDAMDKLKGSVDGVQISVGRYLVPALSLAANALSGLIRFAEPVLDVFLKIPAPVYAVTAAALALNKVLTGEMLASFARIATEGAQMAAGFVLMATDIGVFTTASALASAAWTKLTTALLANPITATIAGVAAAIAFVATQASDASTKLDTLAKSQKEVGKSNEQLAQDIKDSLSVWQEMVTVSDSTAHGWLQSIPVVGTWAAALLDWTGTAKTMSERVDELKQKMGEYAAVAATVTVAQNDLNNDLAKFMENDPSVTWDKIIQDAKDAADAQSRDNQIREESAKLIAAQSGELDKLVNLRLQEKGLLGGTESAYQGVEQAAHDLAKATDNAKTKADENRIAMEKLADSVNTYVEDAVKAGTPTQTIIDRLNALKSISPDTASVINTAIQGIKDKDIKVTTSGTDKAKQDVESITGDKDVKINMSTTGYFAVKRVLDYLTQDREMKIKMSTSGYFDVKRVMDYLAQDREMHYNMSTRGYFDVKRVMDYLSRDRDMYINVRYRTINKPPAGTTPAAAMIASTTAVPSQQAATVTPLAQTFNFYVSNPDPNATVRAIDRAFRKGGNPNLVSVTA